MSAYFQPIHITTFPLFDDSGSGAKNFDQSVEERTYDDLGRKIRIIVIDDEAVIAETVVEILNHEGFEALSVSSGLSAVELAKSWSPDIILSDVIMPGLNGVETGIKIREMSPRCKIILFSGQAATVDLLEKAREQGHRFDILAKPIKPEQLVSVIRAAAERKF